MLKIVDFQEAILKGKRLAEGKLLKAKTLTNL